MSKSQWGFNLNSEKPVATIRSVKAKPVGMAYSVIAKTNIKAFSITKEDLMQKLSKDI